MVRRRSLRPTPVSAATERRTVRELPRLSGRPHLRFPGSLASSPVFVSIPAQRSQSVAGGGRENVEGASPLPDTSRCGRTHVRSLNPRVRGVSCGGPRGRLPSRPVPNDPGVVLVARNRRKRGFARSVLDRDLLWRFDLLPQFAHLAPPARDFIGLQHQVMSRASEVLLEPQLVISKQDMVATVSLNRLRSWWRHQLCYWSYHNRKLGTSGFPALVFFVENAQMAES